jgi:hypothetical protein
MASTAVVSWPAVDLLCKRGFVAQISPDERKLFIVPKRESAGASGLQVTPGRRDELRPEIQLVLCCARTRLSAAYIDRIRLLVRPDLNWAAVIAAADRMGLTPLVFEHLRKFETRVPPLWLERLEKAYRTNATRSLYLTTELLRVLELFESRDINAIPYKGPVLAAQAYGDLAYRQFHDIDIIVPQQSMAEANSALLSSGFRARFPWPHEPGMPVVRIPGEYTYRGEDSECLLELHTEFTMRHFPVRADLDTFGERLVNVSVGGTDVRTFCPEDALVVLCVHGAKDFWSKLAWVADLSELISSAGRVNWDLVFDTAESLNAERMLLLGLSLAHDMLDTRLPVPVFERIQADRTVGSLTQHVERKLLSARPEEWNLLQRAWFRARLVPQRFEGMKYLWRVATQPAEDEWTAAHGSVWSAAMQSLLRPLRLVRKQSGVEIPPNHDAD